MALEEKTFDNGGAAGSGGGDGGNPGKKISFEMDLLWMTRSLLQCEQRGLKK